MKAQRRHVAKTAAGRRRYTRLVRMMSISPAFASPFVMPLEKEGCLAYNLQVGTGDYEARKAEIPRFEQLQILVMQ